MFFTKRPFEKLAPGSVWGGAAVLAVQEGS
jgi:hypothetical protein